MYTSATDTFIRLAVIFYRFDISSAHGKVLEQRPSDTIQLENNKLTE